MLLRVSFHCKHYHKHIFKGSFRQAIVQLLMASMVHKNTTLLHGKQKCLIDKRTKAVIDLCNGSMEHRLKSCLCVIEISALQIICQGFIINN